MHLFKGHFFIPTRIILVYNCASKSHFSKCEDHTFFVYLHTILVNIYYTQHKALYPIFDYIKGLQILGSLLWIRGLREIRDSFWFVFSFWHSDGWHQRCNRVPDFCPIEMKIIKSVSSVEGIAYCLGAHPAWRPNIPFICSLKQNTMTVKIWHQASLLFHK